MRSVVLPFWSSPAYLYPRAFSHTSSSPATTLRVVKSPRPRCGDVRISTGAECVATSIKGGVEQACLRMLLKLYAPVFCSWSRVFTRASMVVAVSVEGKDAESSWRVAKHSSNLRTSYNALALRKSAFSEGSRLRPPALAASEKAVAGRPRRRLASDRLSNAGCSSSAVWAALMARVYLKREMDQLRLAHRKVGTLRFINKQTYSCSASAHSFFPTASFPCTRSLTLAPFLETPWAFLHLSGTSSSVSQRGTTSLT